MLHYGLGLTPMTDPNTLFRVTRNLKEFYLDSNTKDFNTKQGISKSPPELLNKGMRRKWMTGRVNGF